MKALFRRVWRLKIGYWIAWGLVREEFAPLNINRVHRVWKELKLGRARWFKKKRIDSSVPLKAKHPNHVWCVDFIHDSCLNGTKLKVLSAVDEFTRECLALEVGSRLNSARVRQVLSPLFKERGAPNGGEFISQLLAVFLAQSVSGSHFINPGSPWQNGFVESFHSTLRRDCLDVDVFMNLADAQVKLAVYRRYCNEIRPHSSLGYRPPASAARDWEGRSAKPD